VGTYHGDSSHIRLFLIPARRQEDITTIHTIYTIKFSELRKVLRKISLKSFKKKWAFAAIPLLFIITALLNPVFGALSSSVTGEERLQVVSSGESLGLAQGGPTIHSASIVFASGIRNANIDYVYAPEAFYGYGAGPTEPSLASATGGSLLKQSSPLTTATAENVRTNIIKYTVRPGDIPSIIAASFGITTNTLLWSNNLSDGQLIRPGDELIILPVSGVRYKVQQGDTISSIASRYKGEIDKIIAFNGLGAQGGIIAGDYIIIPDGELPVRSSTGRVVAKYAPYTQNLDSYFIHPTAGVGYKSRGLHPHNAVDIAASCWTPVYAAAAGTVAISDGYGWNGGYGKYVKIDHADGVGSLYSHNIQNEVSAGQYVQQGQLIAYMGSTGRSTGCHVHWEVYGALNPLR